MISGRITAGCPILRLLPAGVPVLCTTATANDRCRKDIENPNPEVAHSSRRTGAAFT